MAESTSIESIIQEHLKVAIDLPISTIKNLTEDIDLTFAQGGKLIFFGNGGSATQACHWAEEFVGRFVKRRRSLPAIALGTNFANITGISNDYGFEEIFNRELEAIGEKKDLAIGISTSGNSPNVIKGLKKAKFLKIKSWILTGNTRSLAKKIADKSLSINSDKTARIQEMHSLVIHIVLSHFESETIKNVVD
jgi:D-sedoheptulose 7-phosphate isomerase